MGGRMNTFTTILSRDDGDLHIEVEFSGERADIANGYRASLDIQAVTDLSGAPVQCTAEEYAQLINEASRQLAQF